MSGGQNLAKLPTESRTAFRLLFQISWLTSVASKTRRIPGTVKTSASVEQRLAAQFGSGSPDPFTGGHFISKQASQSLVCAFQWHGWVAQTRPLPDNGAPE